MQPTKMAKTHDDLDGHRMHHGLKKRSKMAKALTPKIGFGYESYK